MHPAVLTCLIALGLLMLVITIKTLLFKRQIPVIDKTITAYPKVNDAVKHLREIIGFKTVSNADSAKTNWQEFLNLHKWLQETYPATHSRLEKIIISDYTLIYHWKGSDPTRKPVLYTAHQDVVPVGDIEKWIHNPYSGDISEDGFLWGRGSLDIKIQMIAILETIEFQLLQGYSPQRGIYLCFGHDEEVGGKLGAAKAAEYFRNQGVSFSFLIDEGGAVTNNMISGLKKPFAAIGVGEKGYLDVELSCTQKGGHSSMPPAETALGLIARAIAKLEKTQFPLKLTKVPREMFKNLGPFMPLHYRIILANLWFFKPLFLLLMAGNGAPNAMIRTTTAPTMASGSQAPNVLAARAAATINLRLLTGTSSNQAIARIRRVIRDKRIELKTLLVNEPSEISPMDTVQYRILSETILQVFPDSVVSPYLMLGGTDAIKYQDICENIFRFCPMHVHSSELDRIHSYNERISLKNIENAVIFFSQLFVNIDNKL
ncbi:MAG: M20/M25/M40 family metallo-hydrolase [Spirochaetes bacterium]|nr:M20/M25/M40 family metallo-hydrolase [Spirochaetota bacterium]MBL7006922.1 M20/M25/M40 family metallo-hydrolase [Spirochaetia bacterium]